MVSTSSSSRITDGLGSLIVVQEQDCGNGKKASTFLVDLDAARQQQDQQDLLEDVERLLRFLREVDSCQVYLPSDAGDDDDACNLGAWELLSKHGFTQTYHHGVPSGKDGIVINLEASNFRVIRGPSVAVYLNMCVM